MPGLESKTIKVIIKGVYLTLFFCLTLSPCFAQTELPIASATASSSFSSSYPPSNTIDNDYRTYWQGGRAKGTWWLKLDLGQSYTLSQISIWWFKENGSTNYNIQTSSDDTTWTNLWTGLSSAGGSTNPYEVTHDLSGSAQYVRIYIFKAQRYQPNIFEVKIYGEYKDTTPPTGTIKINNDAAATNSTSATLTLSAQDNFGGSGLAQMQLSNDNTNWSAPENYVTTKSWTLTSGDGTKTVYVKFKDVAGNWSGVYSDTIILDTTLPTGSILINNGDTSTDYWDVALSLSATDTGSGMDQGAQMKFSNDNSNWSTPESYSSTKYWRLLDGFGTKKVYARFKDVAGNWMSQSISDTIDVINVPKERIHIYLNGKRIAMQENDKKYFYHADHLGGANIVTNESGQLVRYVEYKPFGESKVDEGTLAVKRKFTGKELDESTGLYDYSARQYDPKIGRFISPDPLEILLTINKQSVSKDSISFRFRNTEEKNILIALLYNPQNLNRYSYCVNNPIKYTDPDGLDYWIEGPSIGEPRGHQSINVGDPNKGYDSYSFGVNRNLNLKYGLEGEVYRDSIQGGKIDPKFYRKTNSKEDMLIKAELESQVQKKGAYLPWSTCRSFSQQQFKKFTESGYGQSSNVPERKINEQQPSSVVPSSSSTVILTEPYGPFSSSTESTRKIRSTSLNTKQHREETE